MVPLTFEVVFLAEPSCTLLQVEQHLRVIAGPCGVGRTSLVLAELQQCLLHLTSSLIVSGLRCRWNSTYGWSQGRAELAPPPLLAACLH